MAGHSRTLLFLSVLCVQALLVVYAGTLSRRRPNIQDALLSYMCRGTNSRICSGSGVCQSGQCICNTGYSGETCEVSEFPVETTTTVVDKTTKSPTNLTACSMDELSPCNGNGVCDQGLCRCDSLFSGFRCELSMQDGFCKTYLECAECTALMTSCPEICKTEANFILVFGFKLLPSPHTCRYKNVKHNCSFVYKLAGEDSRGVKDIKVQACIPGSRTTTAAGEEGQTFEMDRNVGGPGSGATTRKRCSRCDRNTARAAFECLAEFDECLAGCDECLANCDEWLPECDECQAECDWPMDVFHHRHLTRTHRH